MTDKTELLPCPFCGGEAYQYAPGPIEHHITCKNYKECGADINRDTEAEAIAAWNARAERGTLTAEQVRRTIMDCSRRGWAGDDDCWHIEGEPQHWQRMADELNAELGGGNCARCAEDMGRYADSLCDQLKERIAELLRCLENDWHIHASWDGLRKFWCIELTEAGVKLRDAAHGTLTAEQVREAIFHGSVYASYDGAQYYANGINMQAIADELNARAERTCECVAEYAKSLLDGKTIVLHRCSECHELMRPHMRYCPNCGRKVSA